MNLEEEFSNVTKETCGTVVYGEAIYKSISFEIKEIICLSCDAACSACDSKGTAKVLNAKKDMLSIKIIL